MAHRISFLNTDSKMVEAFMRFLREGLSVPDKSIFLTMRLYPHSNETVARRYWMRATGLPASQFKQTTVMISGASKGRRPYNRLPYGTLQITVNDTTRFHHLLGLIEGVKEKAGYGTMPSLPG